MAGVDAAASTRPAPRDFTLEELRAFNGENGAAIYICVKGVVFDMSSGRDFYGPGGAYAVFAGHDATRALAKMSVDAAVVNDRNTADLTADELDALNGWFTKFQSKYPVVGQLVEAKKDN